MTDNRAMEFVLGLTWRDVPMRVQEMVKLNLLDTVGVAVGGHGTRLSQIIRNHAHQEFAGALPMLFDGRGASASGVALAAGLMIDSLDGHDGFNPAKGHIGCPLIAALLPLAVQNNVSGERFLTALVAGYEFGARAAKAQHGTCPDYHTSGSWGAVTGAAAISRLLGLDLETARHAIGIAEYHGPRSQMMRCIDHPTMLKDGSGWGAMAAVSAVKLAQAGFTGAPAITVENAPEYWDNLGAHWYTCDQYYKPYPVCRWAQAPIEGVLALRKAHSIEASDVERIEAETFHESVRLAMNTPGNTEEAQYSTSYPTAVALVRGDVTAADISDAALGDPEIIRLSQAMEMREHEFANAQFPTKRFARVTLHLREGQTLTSDWMEPKWDHTEPPTATDLREKFHKLADPVIGEDWANAIEAAIDRLETASFDTLADQLFQPING